MMRKATFIAAALGASLWHAGAAACTSDSECKGDRVCVNGACQDAKPPAGAATAPTAAAPTAQKLERTAPVQFRARKGGEIYKVVVGSASCETPCTLRLEPGGHHVAATGSANFEFDVQVPETGTAVDLISENRPVKALGLMLAVTGTISAVGGLAWFIAARRSCEASWGNASVCSYVAPLTLLGVGGAGGLAGYIITFSNPSSRAEFVASPRAATGKEPAVRFLGLGFDVAPSKTPVPVLSFSF